jgi:16S rRNA (guanine527-N7)-methyltransferase
MSITRLAFVSTVRENEAKFDLELTDMTLDRLADHFELVLEHNRLLHLVAPAPAGEFAVRHVLESLTLLKHLPLRAKFADIGPGAGLPSIPCLIARKDLRAVLIESKIKKARFLAEAIARLELGGRAEIVNRQYEEAETGDCDVVVCRALDKFTEKLPRLVRWARGRPLLLFGGENLAAGLERSGVEYNQKLLPLSERRFLFVSKGSSYRT